MLSIWTLTGLVLIGVLACLELGYRIGGRDIQRGGSLNPRGASAIEGAVFALLGLLLAFSFSGAAARFEARRHLIANEVNAISTAWLRLDLLPVDAQRQLRSLFRDYTELRAAFFSGPLNEGTVAIRQQRMTEFQYEIWRGVMDAVRASNASSPAPILLVPALNSMFDIATTRWLATANHPPPIISTLLIGMTFLSAILAGYGMASNPSRNRFHRVIFGVVMTLTIVVIADLEYPRRGFIRIDAADTALQDLAHLFRADAGARPESPAR